MTCAETLAFNAGVEAVLSIARRTADGISRTSRRRVHEEFAVAALSELAEAARALLLPVPSDPGDQAGAASSATRASS